MSLLKFTCLMLSVGLLTGCTPAKPLQTGFSTPDTGKPVLHAIDSGELRELMQRLNNLMSERNLTSPELDARQRKAEVQIIAAAADVDQAIDPIIATLPKLKLEETEQKVFKSLAVNLRNEADQLKLLAETHQLESIPATLDKMNITCISCHKLFRELNKSGRS